MIAAHTPKLKKSRRRKKRGGGNFLIRIPTRWMIASGDYNVIVMATTQCTKIPVELL